MKPLYPLTTLTALLLGSGILGIILESWSIVSATWVTALLLAGWVHHSIRKRDIDEKHLIDRLEAMREGRFAESHRFSESGPTGEVGVVLNLIRDNLVETVRQAKVISTGNYQADVSPRSKEDQLGQAMAEMTRTLREISEVCEKMAEGNLEIEAAIKGDNDLLGHSVNSMVTTLRTNMLSMKEEAWMRGTEAGLATKIRGEFDERELAERAATYLVESLGAMAGGLYRVEQDGACVFLAGYGFSRVDDCAKRLEPGEGLVGQAVQTMEVKFLDGATHGGVLRTGALDLVPREVVALPIVMEGNTPRGVLELYFTKPVPEKTTRLFGKLQETLAIAIQGARSREKILDLLEETQRQSEEVQTQNEELQASQEELRQSNEELEEQTEILKRTEEELRAQQEELQSTNEELEERSQALEEQARTVSAKNRELEDFSKELETKATELAEASRYKSEFLANMSHELRTPLNSLLLLSKPMSDNLDGELPEDAAESAEVIYQAGVDLLELINDILDLSKVEAGRIDLEIRPVRPEGILKELEAIFRPLAVDKGIAFTMEQDENLPDLHTDSFRTSQILKNFLSNAFKFSESGAVKVELRREGNDHLVYHVHDEGIGIPTEKITQIFKAFQQLDGSISRRYGGTGLGLSISKELATLLGGSITVQSEEGAGSTFSLRLPFKANLSKEPSITKTPPQNPRPSISKVESISTPKPVALLKDDREELSTRDGTVLLIIDDDVPFAKVVRDRARRKEYQVIVTQSGESGLKLAEELLPDVIILDLGLPGLDGHHVLKLLKGNQRTRHIPVQIISSRDRDIELLKMGAIDFAIKPIDGSTLDQLLVTLKTMVEKNEKHLLIVEDDPVLRKAMVEMIGHGDIQVQSESTGQDVLRQLRSGRFDCLVLDLRLPDISGFDLLKQIDKDESIGSLPIIIYTGRDLTMEEEAELSLYAKSIIIKGVNSMERLLDEVVLFLHQAHNCLPQDKQEVINLLHSGESDLDGKTILVVDDDMRNTFALSKILHKVGMEVILAENGEKAIQMLDQQPDIQIVLMDVMMPVMDGLEATRRLRKDPRFKDLPVLALTAKAMGGDRERCLQAGANDYLPKPVDVDKLMSLLRVWLFGR